MDFLLQKSYAARQYLLVKLVYFSRFVSNVDAGGRKVRSVRGD